MNDLGKKIKTKRELLGKTQDQVAKSIGVTKRQYQRYEDGLTPKIDTLTKLGLTLNHDFISEIGGINVPRATVEKSHTDEYKDKYISLLEANNDSLRQERDAINRKLQRMQISLKQLENNQVLVLGTLRAQGDMLVDCIALLKKSKVEAVREYAYKLQVHHVAELQKEGNLFGVGK